MGFGGSAHAMITILKNNEKMRTKRERFKRQLGSNATNEKTEYDLPEATPEVLREIRERLKKEHKQRMIKVIALTIVLFLGLVTMLVYL